MSAEGKYRAALASMPAPGGGGCHVAIMSTANLARIAHIPRETAESEIYAAIPRGTRKVTRKEVADAVEKAYSASVPDGFMNESRTYSFDSALPDLGAPSSSVSSSVLATPADWDPASDFITFLSSVFDPDEIPCICTSASCDEAGHYRPSTGGNAFRTAGELCQLVRKSGKKGEEAIRDAIGDWGPGGVWIRANPVSRGGKSDRDVTAYRHVLVESDSMPPESQLALIKELKLPCTVLTSSGGKSIHALVKVDARGLDDYHEKFDFIKQVCGGHGLDIDQANRNPSRYCRLAGATRGGNSQHLISGNCGLCSFDEWRDYISGINDDLPELEDAASFIDSPPPLADCLISGVLRRRHKLMVTGPSKAGKTFLLMELALAISTGTEWLGWECARGKALYVNFELDSASCKNRFSELCIRTGLRPGPGMLDVWNLRGKIIQLAEWVPRLARRCRGKEYAAIIIDPIYKIMSGDESDASAMSIFCGHVDRIVETTGASVVLCHHHSKGQQGQKKAMDRGSGSGVFARDPDALLDMIEVEISDDRRRRLSELSALHALEKLLDNGSPAWRNVMPQDDQCILDKVTAYARESVAGADETVMDALKSWENATAWRIDGILREFPPFRPGVAVFRYPVHELDRTGILADALAEGEEPTPEQRQRVKADAATLEIDRLSVAYNDILKMDGVVTIESLADFLAIGQDTARKKLAKYGEAARLSKDRKGVITRNEN